MTDEELDEALAELEDTRETVEKELKAISARRETLENLERDKDTLLEYYARMTPAALDALSSEERHQVYKRLRLAVEISPDGSLDCSGVHGDSFVSENEDERLGSNIQTLTTPELMFRALLMKDGTQRLELARTWRTDISTYAL